MSPSVLLRTYTSNKAPELTTETGAQTTGLFRSKNLDRYLDRWCADDEINGGVEMHKKARIAVRLTFGLSHHSATCIWMISTRELRRVEG